MTAADHRAGRIDIHCAAGTGPGYQFTEPEPVLAAMDVCGVDRSVLGPIGRWAAVDHADGEAVLRSWCERWPDRFLRWVTVNPWYDDAAQRLAEVIEPAVGLKLAPALQGFSLLQLPLVRPLLEVAARYGKPVYVVTGVPIAGEPFQVTELARQFPDVVFVMGRSGRTDFSVDLLPALQGASNIIAETAYNGADLIADLVRALGPGRMAFASDQPFNDLDLEIARIGRADLTAAEFTSIYRTTPDLLIGGRR